MSTSTHSVISAAATRASNLWAHPVLSSESLDWPGLIARRYLKCLPARVVLPPVHEDVLIVTVSGKTRLDGAMSRRFSGEIGTPGLLWFTPHGVPSEWINSDTVSVLHLYIQPKFLATLAAEAGSSAPERIELRELLSHRDPLLELLAKSLLRELTYGQAGGQMYAESLIHTIGAHLLHHYSRTTLHGLTRITSATDLLAPTTLQRVIDYIQDRIACTLTLKEVAAYAGFSPYHFARLFKRSTGQPLHQYIIERRVELAKQLLITNQHTVAEVATLVGFHDQSHLYRHFNHLVGVPPSALLEQRKNIHRDRKKIQDENERAE